MLIALAALALAPVPAPAQERGLAYSVTFDRVVDRRAALDLERVVEDARRRKAEVVILRLNTPGGEVVSVRKMVATIVAAPMPVIVFVHPSGSRANSAGVLLTLAADVAAMAPQTNIGSATPVAILPRTPSASEEQLLKDLRRKAINDLAAFARGLAESRGHNGDLAERMVRTSENVSASRALKAKLIDVVATDERALLRSLEGFTVKGRERQRLRTRGLAVQRFDERAVTVTDVDNFDNFSTVRFVAYLAAVPILLALTIIGYGRGRKALRRRQVRRHREKLERRRASEAADRGPQ